MTDEQIEQIFTYHPPFGTQTKRYEELRSRAKSLAHFINRTCPESREKSTAITNIQQAVMWANAAIAINESEGPGALARTATPLDLERQPG